jgi:putative ABC transport system ATP-binding protein
MNQSIIECNSLCKHFNGKNRLTKAVDGVDLQINQNEFVLIKGRSGAGKSTLLNLMCGLDKPSSGSVTIGTDHIGNMSNKSLSRLLSEKIGIIFQNFNLLPTYTVFENIEIALAALPGNREKSNQTIIPMLEQLNLSEKMNSLPTELSIGQQQKVAIARTLSKSPSIIFADEPTGSVDDETAREIIEYFLMLKKEKNVTLVMATHGSTLDPYADRIVVMQEGRLVS